MPLGPYQTFGDCVRAQQNKGHSKESAERICGAMEQEAASITSQDNGEQNEDNNNMSAEESNNSEKVELSGSELTDVTQGLTDAKAFAESAGALPEVIESINKAYDIIYGKMDVAVEGESEAAPPF